MVYLDKRMLPRPLNVLHNYFDYPHPSNISLGRVQKMAKFRQKKAHNLTKKGMEPPRSLNNALTEMQRKPKYVA